VLVENVLLQRWHSLLPSSIKLIASLCSKSLAGESFLEDYFELLLSITI